MVLNKFLLEGLEIVDLDRIKLLELKLIEGTDFLKSDFSIKYHVFFENGTTYSSHWIRPKHIVENTSRLKELKCMKFNNNEDYKCKKIQFEFQNLTNQKILLFFKI